MKKGIRWLDSHWQELTVGLLSVLLLISVMTGLQASMVLSAAAMDWGLSFGERGSIPRGNLSQSRLAQYDACYLGNTEEKVLYLTFDAGYENGYTEQILDVLAKYQVPAAFFLVGHYFETNPELVARMVNEGHLVGNHTANHPDLAALSSKEELAAELRTVEEQYYAITEQDMPKFFRPPRGRYDEKTLQWAQELGYRTVFWSLAYADWDTKNQPDPSYAVEKLSGRIHNGAILLLHSTSATNAKILETLILKWQKEGYVFKSLNDLG